FEDVGRKSKSEVPCLALRRASSLATHRPHGLLRWASHSFWVGKLLTFVHPEKVPMCGWAVGLALRCGTGGCIRYQTTRASAAAWRGFTRNIPVWSDWGGPASPPTK